MAVLGAVQVTAREPRAMTAVRSPHRVARGGRRADLEGRYFRSRWEANYARYLRWLVSIGEIQGWEYEPRTFTFPLRRGTTTYTPDFAITENDGRVVYHEVKGWMDAKSRTRLARMAKYHPDVSLLVIDEAAYRAIARWAGLIEGWEHGGEGE